MNNDAKYIVFGSSDDYPATPIVFPDYLQHSHVANAFRRLLGEPSSAGFVTLTDDGPLAYGESLSLRLKSADADTKLIQRFLKR